MQSFCVELEGERERVELRKEEFADGSIDGDDGAEQQQLRSVI